MPENILELKDKFEVFVFDIYGVVWDGKKLFDGVAETLEKLRKEGKKIILLSNSTASSFIFKEKYAERGLVHKVHYDDLVTSGDLAKLTFLEDNRPLKFYQLFRRNEFLFEGTGYEELSEPADADFVYIGTPQMNGEDYLTLEPFIDEIKKIKDLNKVMICANPDLKAHEQKYEQPVIRQGSIALYYQELGGEVEYFGKPYPEIFDYALRKYPDIENNKILMVGDTLGTDILGGNSYGIKTALVLTGISYEDMQEEGFASIEEYIEDFGVEPDYVVKRV